MPAPKLFNHVMRVFDNHEPPGLSKLARLVIHPTPASLWSRFWRSTGPIKDLKKDKFFNGMSFDECVESITMVGYWGFAVDTEFKVHIWTARGPDGFPPSGVTVLLAHELGHLAEAFPRPRQVGKYPRGHLPQPGIPRDEIAADLYAEVAVITSIWHGWLRGIAPPGEPTSRDMRVVYLGGEAKPIEPAEAATCIDTQDDSTQGEIIASGSAVLVSPATADSQLPLTAKAASRKDIRATFRKFLGGEYVKRPDNSTLSSDLLADFAMQAVFNDREHHASQIEQLLLPGSNNDVATALRAAQKLITTGKPCDPTPA